MQWLSALRELTEDWDGDGAAKPSQQAIATATTIIRDMRDRLYMQPPSNIVASPCGNVVIEWYDHSGTLVLDIGSQRVRYYLHG